MEERREGLRTKKDEAIPSNKLIFEYIEKHKTLLVVSISLQSEGDYLSLSIE